MRVILILLIAVFAGCATITNPDGTTQKQTFTGFVRADVERARDIAKASDDVAGLACAEAILKKLPATDAQSLNPNGAFSGFMVAREVRRRVDKGVDPEIHNACAVLVLDAEETLVRLGLRIVPGGGLAAPLMGK